MTNNSLSTQSLRSAFKFPFQSKDWISRFVIGVALLFASMIIPIIPALFVYGYLIEVMRQSILGEDVVLPAWTNWGKLLKDGLSSFVVSLVYLGPAMVVFVFGLIAYMVMVFGSIAVAPDSSASSSGLFTLMLLGGMGIFFFSIFLGWFLLIAGAIPLPAAIAHFSAKGKLGAAFHLREWSAIIRADKWGYFISWVVVLGLGGLIYIGFMLVYFTFIFCFVGYLLAIPIGFYVMLVSTALFGQSYRESVNRANADQVSK
jgi:hypothetical protein